MSRFSLLRRWSRILTHHRGLQSPTRSFWGLFAEAAKRRARSPRPLLEQLEDRTLLSDTTTLPETGPVTPDYEAASRIEIYKDFNAWWGENKDESILQELGYVKGVDYGVRPTSALQSGISADAKVVIITSNSFGSQSTANNVNHPTAQANLSNFVQNGGVLVMHLADNLSGDSFQAPGLARVTTSGPFTNAINLATTNDPIVWGPDRTAATADDLTQSNIQWLSSCCAIHGYLPALPAGATTIISSGGVPVLAKYPRGSGTVIVTSMTMEFGTTGNPGVGDFSGYGMPRRILRNELYYATTVPLNQPPTANADGPYTVPEGGSVMLIGSGTDPDGDPLTFSWDLNFDGTFETPGESLTFSAAGRDGLSSQTVVLRVCDNKSACATSNSTVNITNVPPTITSVTNSGPINEGSSAAISVSATDPAGVLDPLSYQLDCNNDGIYDIGPQPGNSASCFFADNGNFLVKVRVSDGDGGVAASSTTVTVHNVAPTAVLSNGGAVNACASGTVSFSGQFDPSAADTNQGFTYSYDFDNDGNFEVIGSSLSSATVPGHFLHSGGPREHTVRARIADKDAGVTDYTTTIHVNAAVQVDLPSGGGTFEMLLDGTHLVFRRQSGEELCRTQANLAPNATVNGTSHAEALRVLFAGGNPIPAGGLTFHGGTGGSDSLVLQGGTFATITYNYTNANDGTIDLDGSVISYTGLEPIVNTGSATNIIFNLPGKADAGITLSDLGGGIARLASATPTFERTDFAYPTAGGSMTINMGANDQTITVTSLALNANTDLIMDGQGGSDTVNLNAAAGLSIADALSLTAETIAQSGPVTVMGTTTLDAGTTGTISLTNPGNNFSTVSITSGNDVTLVDANAIELSDSTVSGNFSVTAAGLITDAASTTISVTGLATLSAGLNAVTLGDQPGDTTNFGSLNVTGGAVQISEDSGTDIVGTNTAASLDLDSTGAISDAGATSVAVTGLADFAGTAISLGGGTFNAGTLRLNSAGAVVVSEDSATDIVSTNTAGSLDLDSTGAISDAGATSVSVTGLADFAGTAISLGGGTANFGSLTFNSSGAVVISKDSPTDIVGMNTAGSLDLDSTGAISDAGATSVAVTELADFAGTSISLGGGAANFGTLTFNSSGAVVISEDSATDIVGTNTAGSLDLDSTGAISDAGATSVAVTGLADFAGTSISLGGGTANFGALTATADAVLITEDSDSNINLLTATTSLTLTSAGAILDHNGSANNIATANPILNAAAGIGTALDSIESMSSTLTASGGSGGIFLVNTGALTILSATAAGAIDIAASSALTVRGTVQSTGDITLTAADSATAGDDLIVLGGALVRSTGGSVALRGGDNLHLQAGTTVRANGTLTIRGDWGDADSGVGATVTISGTVQSETSSIDVLGAGDNDVIVVDGQSTAVAGGRMSVSTGDGNDEITVNLVSPTAPIEITLDGGSATASDSVLVNGTGAADLLVLNGLVLTHGSTLTLTLTGVENLAVAAGAGNDTLSATGTSVTGNLTLVGQEDDDTITINHPITTGVLKARGGTHTAMGGDTLIVNTNSAGSDAVIIENDDVHLTNGQSTNYADIETLTLDTAGGADVVTVIAANVGFPTTVNANSGDGDDDIEVILADPQIAIATTINIDAGPPPTGPTGDSFKATDNRTGNNAVTFTASGLTSGQVTVNLTSIEEIDLAGGEGDNEIDASAFAGDVTIDGGGGDDVIIGGSTAGGGDLLIGGAGADKILGGLGADIIFGGINTTGGLTDTDSSTDIIFGGLGLDQIDGGNGNDIIFGGTGGALVDTNGDGTSDIIFGGVVTGSLTDSDASNDIIFGGLGQDQIDGGSGSDIIFGGTGAGLSDSDGGSDIIFGGLGLDQIDGGGGDDIIFGGVAGGAADTDGTGSDIIFGGLGSDQIDGGAGSDIIFGGVAGGTADSDTGGDIIFGGLGTDQIDGGGGNDIIFGGTAGGTSDADTGSDIIFGGLGTDAIDAGAGNDIIFGGTGGVGADTNGDGTSDIIFGGVTVGLSDSDTSVDLIFGGLGSDQIDGGAGNDIIFGGTGGVAADTDGDGTSDIIFGGVAVSTSDNDTSNDVIFGGVGSDRIDGGAGSDIIFGGTAGGTSDLDGTGNDIIFGGLGADQIDGGGGNDIIFGGTAASLADADTSNDIIFGGLGSDRIDAGAGDDIIFGGTAGAANDADATGNDIIFGGLGSDQIDGGSGNDIIFGGTALGTSDADAGGSDIIFGGLGLDQIDGGAGNDIIYGGVTGGANDPDTSGSDIIFGGLGADQIDGGGGGDIIFGGTAGASADADTGSDIIYGGMGGDQIDAGAGNDIIFGGTGGALSGTSDSDSAGNDIIYGGLGQDQIDGGSGSDIIYGGIADGTSEGNTGSDIIYGGLGGDLINGSEGNDIIYGGVASGAADTDTGSDIIYGGLGLDNLDGGGGNDIIYGGIGDPAFTDSGNDIIFGGAGNDYLSGEAGNDALDGGAGNDTYLFAGGNLGSDTVTEAPNADSDTLDFSSFAGAVTFDLALTTAQTVNAGNLTLTLSSDSGIENVIGSSSADTVSGNSRDNQLSGADLLDDRITSTTAWDGRTQLVYLDFDFSTGTDEQGRARTEHVYTQAERDAIQGRIAADYAQFQYSFTQTCPISVPAGSACVGTDFATLFFNKTPILPNGKELAGGLASEKDFRNVNLGGTAAIDVNRLLGGLGEPVATSANFIALSATIGAHELCHLVGCGHADAFGPPGFGIHNPPDPDEFIPVYPGPISAFETPFHLIASPASVGSTLFDAVGDPFFGEREAIKVAFGQSATVQSEVAAKIQGLTLVGLNTPNTLVKGLNAGKQFAVGAVAVTGSISLGADGHSESDNYTFVGRAGDIINIELFSKGLERIKNSAAGAIDSVIRVKDAAGNLIAYYSSSAQNDDNFEPTDSSITDLVLPADGTYTIEVDTFSAVGDPDCGGSTTDACLDTDTGNYELFIYRFDAGNAVDLGDNFDGRAGNDTLKGYLGNDQLVGATGSDFIFGGVGLDHLVAGPGDDNLDGGDGDDILVGGEGNDILMGRGGDDQLTGSEGNDVLVGGFGADRIVGSAGNDILIAGDVVDGTFASFRGLLADWQAAVAATGANLAGAQEITDDVIDETLIDTTVDVLTGSSGADLFITSFGDLITDLSNLKKLASLDDLETKEGDVIQVIA